MSDMNDSKQTNEDVTPRGGGIDILQLLFWLCLTAAAGAAGVALTWQDKAGMLAPILLVALGALILVLVVWMMRGAGRQIGLFPDRGAAEEAAQKLAKGYNWLEALEEPSLITENGGACVKANAAYMSLSGQAHEAGDNIQIMSVDRLFGANPGMAAPIYRLSKAVQANAPRTEVLPAILMGDSPAPTQFEASVSPLGKTKSLWRLRRLDAAPGANSAVDPRALYVEDAPVGFFSARRDGRVVYVNSNIRKMLGLPDELDGLRLEDLMKPEGLRLLKRETRGGAQQRGEVVLRSRNGVELPALLTTSWTGKGPDALSRSVVHLAYDPEKPPESTADNVARPDQPVFDDTMFTDAPFGVARLDGDGVENAVILDVNQALRDMTEARAQPGARFSDLFVEDDSGASLPELLARALDGAVELKLTDDDAQSRTVDVFVALDRRGRPAAAYVIDTTDRKQLELRLAQSEKLQAMGELASGIAHDFNNLLQGIMLNTDKLIIRHPPGDPSFFELKSINALSTRAAELVRMLLAWSRKQTFKREILDVSELLSDYHVLLRQIINERIKLDMVHGRDLPLIKADRTQIETALTNLCTNARDAMLEKNGGGELVVRTSRADAAAALKDGFNLIEEGDYVLIEVADNGVGIPPEMVEKIFQPYVTTKDKGKGTGLGLATVYGIVKQSGGYIYPVSKVGRGTTFKIFLPAYTPSAEEAEEREEAIEKAKLPTDVSGRGRILLVEDEEPVRGVAAHLLASLGYQVLEAGDGEEALELIREHSGAIDLLISDVVLPGMDGPALLKAAQSYLTGARVLFISGYADREFAKTLDDNQEISFLPKPFTLHQLAAQVKQLLGSVKEAA